MFHFSVPVTHRVPVVVAKQDSIDTAIGRIQARQSRSIGRMIERGIRRLIGSADEAAILAALGENNTAAILELLNLQGLVGVIADAHESVTELVVSGATAGRNALPAAMRSSMPTALEIVSPFIQPFVEARGAALVTLVSDSQRKTIQDLIAASFQQGRALTETATDITQTVGLLPRHALAVQRFRATLIEEGLSAARATVTAQGYATRLLRVRAMSISRTESMFALSAGQQESWQVAIRDGLIDAGQTQRVWTVFQPCPAICDPIPGRGPVGLNEPFLTGQGAAVMYPPAHPNCRCGVDLLIEE